MPYEVDFLAVGDGERSGDAIALRFGNLTGPPLEKWVVVIDGGFADTGEKLVEHIKAHYGTTYVDIAISTHPDSDHSAGLEAVLEQMTVGQLWMHRPWEHTDDIAKMFNNDRVTDMSVSEALRKSLDSARTLEKIANKKGIPIFEPFAGLSGANNRVHIIGPSEKFYESLLPNFRCTPAPKVDYTSLYALLTKGAVAVKEAVKTVLENWSKETLGNDGVTSAENDSNAIILVEGEVTGNHLLLFTGDAGISALWGAVATLDAWGVDRQRIGFVQIPHHGSRRNVGPDVLNQLLNPIQPEGTRVRTAYVSASKEGAPKHPAKKVTNAFKRRGCSIYGTNDGNRKWHHHNSPNRGWPNATELPLYGTVEESED